MVRSSVDSIDPAWGDLLLWTDRNHDGMSTADELLPIAQSSVVALGTDDRPTRRKDQWGNEYRFRAELQFRAGATEHQRAYYDIFFVTGD